MRAAKLNHVSSRLRYQSGAVRSRASVVSAPGAAWGCAVFTRRRGLMRRCFGLAASLSTVVFGWQSVLAWHVGLAGKGSSSPVCLIVSVIFRPQTRRGFGPSGATEELAQIRKRCERPRANTRLPRYQVIMDHFLFRDFELDQLFGANYVLHARFRAELDTREIWNPAFRY